MCSHFADTQILLGSGGRGEPAKDGWPPEGASHLWRLRAFNRVPRKYAYPQNGKLSPETKLKLRNPNDRFAPIPVTHELISVFLKSYQ
jgi:hypothetical protein